jgi:hypothetical protein
VITSLRAPRRCLSKGGETPPLLVLPAQPRANKPSARRLTSSRRFDYLIVKEQRTKTLCSVRPRYFGSKTLSPNQRKERNDNAEFNLVKRVFAASKEAANSRIKRGEKGTLAGNLSVWANSLHERQASGRVCCILSMKSGQRQNCQFAVKAPRSSERDLQSS